jgi:hypothetical protein
MEGGRKERATSRWGDGSSGHPSFDGHGGRRHEGGHEGGGGHGRRGHTAPSVVVKAHEPQALPVATAQAVSARPYYEYPVATASVVAPPRSWEPAHVPTHRGC